MPVKKYPAEQREHVLRIKSRIARSRRKRSASTP